MNDDRHSVDAEPHLTRRPQQTESIDHEPALATTTPPDTDENRAEHNVWDEPWAQRNGLAMPQGAINYATWYKARLQTVTPLTTWTVALALALIGGLLAILGTLLSATTSTLFPLMTVIIFGPAIEEIMKVTAVAITLERRPWLFPHALTLTTAIALSALTFATVENLLYIHIYIEDPTPQIIQWRWTVCTAMHLGATLIAGLGIRQMWRHSRTTHAKPQFRHATPYLIAATIFHGAYNLLATLYEQIATPF